MGARKVSPLPSQTSCTASSCSGTPAASFSPRGAKRKGDQAEREVQTILRVLLGDGAIRRALGAGRQDDVGDIFGLADAVVQVAAYQDLTRAVREKLPALEEQRTNARATFSALFCRRRGGRYVVVMTPEMFATFYREATS